METHEGSKRILKSAEKKLGGASPDISRKELHPHSFAASERKQTLPPTGEQEAVLVSGQT